MTPIFREYDWDGARGLHLQKLILAILRNMTFRDPGCTESWEGNYDGNIGEIWQNMHIAKPPNSFIPQHLSFLQSSMNIYEGVETIWDNLDRKWVVYSCSGGVLSPPDYYYTLSVSWHLQKVYPLMNIMPALNQSSSDSQAAFTIG